MSEHSNVVVHILRQLDFGGVEAHAVTIALNHRLSRYEHRFLVITRGGLAAEDVQRAGLTVKVLGCQSRIPSVRTIIRLIAEIRRARPSIVHTRGAEANFHGLIAAFAARVPCRIGEEIGIPFHSRKARLVFKLLYGSANRVIAISKAVKNWLERAGECSGNKVAVVYNPVQRSASQFRPSFSGDIVLGCVARLEAVKNPLGLIRAVAILRDRGMICRLEFVGDGTQRAELQREVDSKGLEAQVKFYGAKREPFSYLSECNLYVQPSLSEGFGLAIVEAMQAGLPVIATNVGGVSEIIDEGATGWLFGGTRPEDIADKIEYVWGLGPDELAEVSHSGATSVAERFSPEVYIARCDEIYNSILSSTAST